MKQKFLPGYNLKRLIFLVLPALMLSPLVTKAQDTLYYQGWEGEPGKNGLHGFEQYNNQTWSQQNVWARRGGSGVNPGNASVFYVLNPLVPSKQCNDSPFDSCLVSEPANFRGNNGAHIISGALTPNMNYAERNQLHTGYHTGPFCNFPTGCDGNTAATNVGLYSPKIRANKAYTQVKVEFWCKAGGELNRDFGLLKYSTRPDAPQPPIPDGVKNITAPQDFWKTATYPDGSLAMTEFPLVSYNRDTIYGLPMKPAGSSVAGQLQGYRVPSGFPGEGRPIWVKMSYTLPAEAAGDTNLRIGFWWLNDNNGNTAETHFPALAVDEITVIGYKFSADELSDNFYCPKEKISVPFRLDKAFFDKNIAGKDNEFVLHLTDSTGRLTTVRNIGKVNVSELKTVGDEVHGTITGEIPTNVPQLPIGGYRVKVAAPVSGFESTISPTVVTIFPVPTYVLTPKDTTVCPGQPVMLHVEGKADRYEWHHNGKSVKITVEPYWETKLPGIYQVKALINGCVSFTDTAIVRHKAGEPVRFNLPENQDTVCYLTKLNQINGGLPAGGTYFWYYEGRDRNGRTEVRGQSFDSYLAGTGRHIIGYEVINAESGCRDFAFDTLTVVDIPYTKINGSDTVKLCQGRPSNLTLDTPSQSVVWSTGETTNSITVSQPGIYTATLTNEFGCTYTARVVAVLIPPVPQAPTIDPNTRVGDTQVKGTAVASPVAPPTEVRIFINDKLVTTTTVRRDGTYNAFLPNPLRPGDKISAQVGYDTDCDGRITVNDKPSPFTVFIVEEEAIDIPNTFTPNGDGRNDTWVVLNRIRERYPNAHVIVFNRWGNEVYNKENYDNSFDGKDLPDDAYYYVVDLKAPGQDILKGIVHIIR